ncbi:MAG: GNAT family N-acetyltransferase [Terriglobales bacterium]
MAPPGLACCRYRQASLEDVHAMALIRSREWGDEVYWRGRIGDYLRREANPVQALPPRAAYVALFGNLTVGFIAGHLSQRFGCQGELQWINVLSEHRKRGIAQVLLRFMAGWFDARRAARVCVDVHPSNAAARAFYARQGARPLQPNWMVWDDIARLSIHSRPAAGAPDLSTRGEKR